MPRHSSKVNKASKAQKQSSQALLFTLFSAVLYMTAIVMPLMGGRPEQKMFIGLAVGFSLLLTWQLCSNQFITWVKSPLFYAIVGFFIWALLSVFWSVNVYEWSLKTAYLLCGLLAMVTMLQFHWTEQRLMLLCRYGFISGFVIAAIGICQFWFEVNWYQQAVKPASSFGNKNMAAHYILLTLWLGPMLLFYDKHRQWHWFYALGFSAMVAYIFYTSTRAAWLAFAMQIAIAIMLTIIVNKHHSLAVKSKLDKIVASLLLIVILVHIDNEGFNPSAFISVKDRAMSVVNESSLNNPQSNARWALYLNSLLMIKDFPLVGTGFGQWKLEYPVYQQQWIVDNLTTENNQPLKIHNEVIEFLVELGAIGVTIIIAIGVLGLIALCRLLVSKQRHQSLLAWVILLSLSGILTDAQFSFPLQMPMPLTLVFVYITLIIIIFHADKVQSSTKQLPMARLFSAVMAVGLICFSFIWLKSEHYWLKAKGYETVQNFDRLHTNSQKSLNWMPWRHETKFFIAFSLQHRNRHDEALNYYQDIFKYFPHSSSALLRASQSAMLAGQFELAKHYLDRLIAQRPYSAEAHKHQGLLYFNYLGDKVKGANYFKTALELDPNISQAASLKSLVNKYTNKTVES